MNVRPEQIVEMVQNILQRHKGEIASLYLEFEVKSMYSARYDQKIEDAYPNLVIDFK